MKNSVNILSTKPAQLAVLSSISALLAACGGGAGDTATPTAAPTALLATSYNSTASVSALYVASTGSDSNAGTQAAPFRTILKASQVAAAGTTVHVAAGSYPGGFVTSASGTATARIHYVSDTKWGAKIVPPAGSSTAVAWDNRGSYVDIDGFEVDGSVAQGGTAWLTGIYTAGSFDVVENSHVHNIGTAGACSTGGGIGSDSYYNGASNDALANVVHDIGAPGCSTMYGVYRHSAAKPRPKPASSSRRASTWRTAALYRLVMAQAATLSAASST